MMNQVVMGEQEGRGAHQGPGARAKEPGAKKPGEAWIPDPGSKIQRKPSLPSLSSKQMTRDSNISSKNNNSSPKQLSSKQQLTSNLSLLPSLFNISSGTSPSSLTLPSNKQLAREKQYVSSGNKQVSLSSLLSIKQPASSS